MRCVPALFAVASTAVAALCATPASADDRELDAAFAKRVFAGNLPNPKAFACFVRHYDAAHLAQHPQQKVSAMKLLLSTEKDAESPVFQYSFRLGVNFRDRPGDFDSSGECGHAPTIKDPDNPDIPPQDRVVKPDGIDFECNVDCDGGRIAVSLANNDGAVIVRLDRIRI